MAGVYLEMFPLLIGLGFCFVAVGIFSNRTKIGKFRLPKIANKTRLAIGLLGFAQIILTLITETLYLQDVQVAILFISIIIVVSLVYSYGSVLALEGVQEKITQAEKDIQANPEKTKPTWDLATLKLEAYLNLNLGQVKAIFVLSVIVMIIGFALLAVAVVMALNDPGTITPAIVAGIGGVITEFIGATFLFLYRSALEHSSSYISTLDRINSVGVAMQILDNISTTYDGKADVGTKIIDAKIEVSKLLLSSVPDSKKK